MSNKYKCGDKVPSSTLADRLDELSNDITKGDVSQFVMRIPAELDYCPDLVMSQAARRLRDLEAKQTKALELARILTETKDDLAAAYGRLLSAIYTEGVE